MLRGTHPGLGREWWLNSRRRGFLERAGPFCTAFIRWLIHVCRAGSCSRLFLLVSLKPLLRESPCFWLKNGTLAIQKHLAKRNSKHISKLWLSMLFKLPSGYSLGFLFLNLLCHSWPNTLLLIFLSLYPAHHIVAIKIMGFF